MREKEADGDGSCGGELAMGRDDSERVREMQLSIAASSSVFPGFRFSPTDDELISYYLKKKLQGSDNCVDIIPEADFCRYEPWDLPGLSVIQSDNEWFFFSARGKKYPNGSQSKRATQSGYWKATGKERDVKSGAVVIGTKRTLVFHTGRAPKGERTEWIMHEYCMSDTSQEAMVVCRLRRNGDFRLSESSRGPSDHRISSAADDYQHLAPNEYANSTKIDGFDHDGSANAIKTCSMESKSSYGSDSAEQIDSESVSVSDQQLIDSSPYKEGDKEDDCFADIINDDIIQLDESASHSLVIHGVLTGTKYTEILPQETTSAQGTAVRRIKSTDQNHPTKHEKPPSGASGNHKQTSDKKVTGCVFSILGGNANTLSKFHPAYLLLLLLFLLFILLVAWKGNYMDTRQHLGTGIEASRRQLRYWLHKAADNI